MIVKELNPDKKSKIADKILHSLPKWFGLEDSIQDYIKEVRDMLFYVKYIDNKVCGFFAVKKHFEKSADLYVLGILSEYHRRGIGKEFIKVIERDLKNEGIEYLQVKTLSVSNSDEYYARTRKFYKSVGFVELEELKDLWSENNPCLIMIKYIGV